MRFQLIEGTDSVAATGETPHERRDEPRVLIWRGLAWLRYPQDDQGDVATYRRVHAELLGYWGARPTSGPDRWATPTDLGVQIAAASMGDVVGADPWPLPRHRPAPTTQLDIQQADEVVTKGRPS
jgi:hypothetical protein